jgi:hypothetical protein
MAFVSEGGEDFCARTKQSAPPGLKICRKHSRLLLHAQCAFRDVMVAAADANSGRYEPAINRLSNDLNVLIKLLVLLD